MRRLPNGLHRGVLRGVTMAALIASTATDVYAQGERPFIIFLHGRNQMNKADDQLRKEWFEPFAAGLEKIGLPNLIDPTDYDMVFYQDIYRAGAVPVCPADQAEAANRLAPLQAKRDQAQREADLASTQEAIAAARLARIRPGVANIYTPEDRAIAEDELRRATNVSTGLHKNVAAADRAIVTEAQRIAQEQAARDVEHKKRFSAFRDKVAEFFSKRLAGAVARRNAAMAALFPDTDRFITERRFRCATNARLSEALLKQQAAGRPVVVVAHSMGTLVMYDTLFHDDLALQTLGQPPRYRVSSFISVGSQLGVPPLVETFAGGFARPPSPRSIVLWRNLRGDDDYVAPALIEDNYEVPVASRFTEYEVSTIVGDPHNIAGYLTNGAVATTLAYAWCAAFPNGAARPAACDTVKDLPSMATLPGGAKQRWPRP